MSIGTSTPVVDIGWSSGTVSTSDPYLWAADVPGLAGAVVRGAPAKADRRREYVAGSSRFWSSNARQALGAAIDDLTWMFGPRVYETMLQDPKVGASFNTLRHAILSDGVEVMSPRVTPEGSETSPKGASRPSDIALGHEIAEFCRRALDRMDRSIDEVVFEMLEAMAFGNRFAEVVYQTVDSGMDKGALSLKDIKPKPRESAAYVVDPYMNVVGLLGVAGWNPQDADGVVGGAGNTPVLLPRNKFAVLSWQPRNGDPRGTSILRAAYDAWNMKFQLLPDYQQYLRMFASPSLIGTAPEGASNRPSSLGLLNADGTFSASTDDITPQQDLLNNMLAFQNATAMAIPFGAKVEPLEITGDGAAFLNAIKELDRQIVYAILHQTRATEEAQYGSRADSQTGQDVMGLVVRTGRRVVAHMLEQDVLYWLVLYRYGKDAAERWTPTVSLGSTEHQDFAVNATAVARLYESGYIAGSMTPGIDDWLGLPPRLPDEAVGKAQQDASLAEKQAELKPDPAPAIQPDAKPKTTPATKAA